MVPSIPKRNFEERPFFILSLPQLTTIDELQLDQVEKVIINIDRSHIDLGAFCFLNRCNELRKRGRPCGVVLNSLMISRRPQIRTAIEVLSSMMTDGAMRARSVSQFARLFKAFMDWADSNDHHACLSGENHTFLAFKCWAQHVEDRLRRFEINPDTASRMQKIVCRYLELITGCEGLGSGIRLISGKRLSFGTEPTPEHDFAKVVALSQSLFDGLSDLVLTNKSFPFKLSLPRSLGWKKGYLWCFPANQWCLPHHLSNAEDGLTTKYFGGYNYELGRVSTVSEIMTRYRRALPSSAKRAIERCQIVLDAANLDSHHRVRFNLARLALAAFFFLFLANTGCNLAVAREIETDGKISTIVANQSFRTMKFRAGSKSISIVMPLSFLPSLRQFMKLRQYLLQETLYRFLFFSLTEAKDPASASQIGETVLARYYASLRKICPEIPVIMSREIRATVEDYYRCRYDGFISSKIMGRSEASTDRSYLAGSPQHHHSEFSDFLGAVSRKARETIIVNATAQRAPDNKLEEGGQCVLPNNPIPLFQDSILKDCRSGCLFCANRILVANEEDARKVASAAFVMTQLILGPQSEIEFRPKIQKCEEDLAKIASFEGCAAMVKSVRVDVFEKGNLTQYFADKYLMFLEIGVL